MDNDNLDMNPVFDKGRSQLAEMKRRLGINRMVLQVHASCFPVEPDEDLGRGSPYSRGADRLLAFAARLGFDAIQLGPLGLTERGNPSPYDATIFSRNPMDLPLMRLVNRGCLSRDAAGSLLEQAGNDMGRRHYTAVYDTSRRLATELCAAAGEGTRMGARRYLGANARWLVPDALYESLCAEHGAMHWRDWGRTPQGFFDQQLFDPPSHRRHEAAVRLAALRKRHAEMIEDYAVVQYLLAEEHRAFRDRLAVHGLVLFGDLQIGLSARDTWAWKHLFLKNYRMGAPPSRTNPEGQPWGYPVFDPGQYGTAGQPGPVLRFIHTWSGQMLSECDGVRIDHPHGWIDPWTYGTGDTDAYHAVRNGARLFSSPDDPEHPDLRAFAIALADQIDRDESPFADRRVFSLTESQVSRYSLLIDAIMRQAASHGRSVRDIACEVLSTLPYPVQRVLERHGLGRFRVAQKIRLDDPSDVYRIERIQPEDWAMLSTHDTPGIWQLAEDWSHGAESAAWGGYLARLLVTEKPRARFAEECSTRPGALVHALFAALLAGRARHILVFFPDLFGMTERYNRPGTVDDENWMLRIPSNFEQLYKERCLEGKALDVRKCFELALEGRAAGNR